MQDEIQAMRKRSKIVKNIKELIFDAKREMEQSDDLEMLDSAEKLDTALDLLDDLN